MLLIVNKIYLGIDAQQVHASVVPMLRTFAQISKMNAGMKWNPISNVEHVSHLIVIMGYVC